MKNPQSKRMFGARLNQAVPVKLGEYTPSHVSGSQLQGVREVFQRNINLQKPWIIPASDEVRM